LLLDTISFYNYYYLKKIKSNYLLYVFLFTAVFSENAYKARIGLVLSAFFCKLVRTNVPDYIQLLEYQKL